MLLTQDQQDITRAKPVKKFFVRVRIKLQIILKEQGMGKIVLASSSPRRAEILKDYKLEIIPSPYIEKHTKTAFSYDYVENLAYNKALAVLPLVQDDCVIVGADTVVVLENEILEKPMDNSDAFNMLRKLSGKTHRVVTSISMINTKTKKHLIESTTSYVTFENLTDEMISDYIINYKPLDKAGSYGIQELPNGYIKDVNGDFENIIGISSKVFAEMLKKL